MDFLERFNKLNDKVKHILVSIVLAFILIVFLGGMLGAVLTAGVGLAKELVWDLKLKNGKPDIFDFGADLAGIGIGYILYSMFDYFL